MPYIPKNKEHAPITSECETYVPNIRKQESTDFNYFRNEIIDPQLFKTQTIHLEGRTHVSTAPKSKELLPETFNDRFYRHHFRPSSSNLFLRRFILCIPWSTIRKDSPESFAASMKNGHHPLQVYTVSTVHLSKNDRIPRIEGHAATTRGGRRLTRPEQKNAVSTAPED